MLAASRVAPFAQPAVQCLLCTRHLLHNRPCTALCNLCKQNGNHSMQNCMRERVPCMIGDDASTLNSSTFSWSRNASASRSVVGCEPMSKKFGHSFAGSGHVSIVCALVLCIKPRPMPSLSNPHTAHAPARLALDAQPKTATEFKNQFMALLKPHISSVPPPHTYLWHNARIARADLISLFTLVSQRICDHFERHRVLLFQHVRGRLGG